jgi:cytochrome c biogenesis protein
LLSKKNPAADSVESPSLSIFGWLRWIWRQLTSMSTALILLLMLAAAAIPGSLVSQRSADPNGVTTFFKENPQLAPILDAFQLFDVYTSAWFSAIYILLFISLIGCVLPRTRVHFEAMRAEPVRTPRVLSRMPAHMDVKSKRKNIIERVAVLLKKRRYRVAVQFNAAGEPESVSAERGYLRETGNLVFHFSLIGVLLAVGIGGGHSFSGQRVLVEGETFVNNLAGYDSLSPGTFFSEQQLVPFSVKLDKFEADFYHNSKNKASSGSPTDFRAYVTARVGLDGKPYQARIRVNEPLEMPGAKIYLTGNGYAPIITIRDADGQISFSGPTAFLPQDANYTSLGVIKVPDAKPDQFGIISFFYPTVGTLSTGALTSLFPQAALPLLTMNIYAGDLGLDGGDPKNVFALNTHGLKQVVGGKSGVKGIKLVVGQSAKLPNNMGTVSFDGLKRFASLDVDYNPGAGWVLFFALLALAGVTTSLLVPRRRVWVRKTDDGFELAALARGDDPSLENVLKDIAKALKKKETK